MTGCGSALLAKGPVEGAVPYSKGHASDQLRHAIPEAFMLSNFVDCKIQSVQLPDELRLFEIRDTFLGSLF